jgi:hypothetical protein
MIPHLDLVVGLEPVQLVEQLEHGPLHLAVAAATAVLRAGAADRVDLYLKTWREGYGNVTFG